MDVSTPGGSDGTGDPLAVDPAGVGTLPATLPVLPLRETVPFPDTVTPLAVGQERSMQLINDVLAGNRMLVMAASTDPSVEAPGPDGVRRVGVAGIVARMLRVPDGTLRVLVQGSQRVSLGPFTATEPYLVAEVEAAPDVVEESQELEALARNVQATFSEIIEKVPYLPEELQMAVANIDSPGELAHMIAGALRIDLDEKQALLEERDLSRRLRRLAELLARENELISIGSRIQEQVQSGMEATQREYFLRQQLKAIQDELGEVDESVAEARELREQVEAAHLPDGARTQADRELGRLERLPPQAAEHGVIRSYLEWIVSLPWSVSSEDHIDLARRPRSPRSRPLRHRPGEGPHPRVPRGAQAEPRGRLLDPLPGGTPGGGEDLDRALDRGRHGTQLPTAVGGRRARRVRDPRSPAHLHRGDAGDDRPRHARRRHEQPGPDDRRDRQDGRRLPRRPLERDARGARSRAERDLPRPLPRSPLRPLEGHVHHHGQPTRHRAGSAPGPHGGDPARRLHRGGEARDRQALPGSAPARPQRPGGRSIDVTEEALREIIDGYTREPGVRGLEREIGSVCRKIAREVAENPRSRRRVVRAKQVRELLGRRRRPAEVARRTGEPGVATGLAWTPAGGDVLFVEAADFPGEGRLRVTGQLGDVMRESAEAAFSYVKGHARALGADRDEEWFRARDFHLHVPAGAIPKDGPSAGITMATALASLASGRPVRSDTAMTGEITLTGQVLPIGGLKEKALAAQRLGIRRVIAPRLNEPDLEDIPAHLREEMEFVFVDAIDQVLVAALEDRDGAPEGRRAPRRAEQPATA
ncbi:MAG: S16 family serine protease [Thermoleophilaceae bacterium]